MCIRDRYQRRVHGELEELKEKNDSVNADNNIKELESLINELNNKIQSLTNEKEDLSKEKLIIQKENESIDLLKAENEELKQKVEELSNSVELLDEENKNVKFTKVKVEKAREQAEMDLRLKNQEFEGLVKEQSQLKDELIDLRNQLQKQTRQEITNTVVQTDEDNSLQKQVQELQEQLKNKQEELDNLKNLPPDTSMIKDFRSKPKTETVSHQDPDQIKQDYEEEIEFLRNALNELEIKSHLDAKNAQLKEQLKIAALENEFNEKLEEIKGIHEDELIQKDEEITECAKKKTDFESEENEIPSKIKELQSQHEEELEKITRDHKKELADCKTELENIHQKSLDTLQFTIKSKEDELDELQKQIEKINLEKTSKESEIEELKQKLEVQKEEHDKKIQETIQDYESQIEDIDTTNENLQNKANEQIYILEEEINKLKLSIKEKEQEAETLKKQNEKKKKKKKQKKKKQER
eukprot:TRINITY_DN11798_c0_g1_i12.p1 TRINITY_DN11798_c0_g1~~TRINITY_DN11798_c0_g1_i12.p1  ORF type:complete len:469 (+),score=184.77 TRINITY_DN11798_c0_g1_i12:131-1537(+)